MEIGVIQDEMYDGIKILTEFSKKLNALSSFACWFDMLLLNCRNKRVNESHVLFYVRMTSQVDSIFLC